MRRFMVLARLVLEDNLRSWGRTALGLLGVAISVCLVVWVIRGYEAATRSSADETRRQTGRFDVVISPKDRMRPQVDPAFLDRVRKDPSVAGIDESVRSRVRIVKPEMNLPGPFGGAMLMGTAATEPPSEQAEGRWLSTNADAAETVASTSFLERRKLKVGDEMTVGGNGGEAALKIVGAVKREGGMGPMGPPTGADLYVSLPVAAQINGYSGRPNVVGVILKDPAAAGQFAKTWGAQGAETDPPAAVRSMRDTGDDPMNDRMTGMIRVQETNAALLSFLAAAFIIFTTLSVAVRERTRQHAILRAIALSRSQLACMIVFEAVLFAAAGWGLGLLLAKAFLGAGNALGTWLSPFRATMFAGYPLGKAGILFSAAAALSGALAAAVIPAWQAARIKPIDILSGQEAPPAKRFPWILVTAGLVLIAINPVIVWLARYDSVREVLSWTYGRGGFKPPLLGCVAMIAGFAMITPLVVRLADALFAPVLAAVLRLDRRFLRRQLSGNMGRTIGTTVALSTGLSLFVTIQVWGYSMLAPFTPDESLPRMLVSVLPAGLPQSAVAEVASTPGVVPGECLPTIVEQPRLTDEMLKSKPFARVDESQQHLLFMGVEPERAFGGAKPVMPLTFVEGNREDAAKKLATGRFCLVPDNFRTQTGLGVGDRFSVDVPNRRGTSVEYTIAGVVSIPGWHWFTKFSDVRRRSGRALALVFVDYERAKTDFGIDRVSFFWMNADASVPFKEMESRLQPIADRNAGVRVDIPMVGEASVAKQFVKITDRADLTERLFKRANDVIWSITWFPLIVLGITSLAVFNTVTASVRARFWQFGVLRGVGLTRGQIFRLVAAESLLIFAAAAALSLVAGVLMAWCGTNICTYFFYFGGLTPPLVMPWGMLGAGFAIAFGLCALAGLIPAAIVATREPLTFIQKGRLGG